MHYVHSTGPISGSASRCAHLHRVVSSWGYNNESWEYFFQIQCIPDFPTIFAKNKHFYILISIFSFLLLVFLHFSFLTRGTYIFGISIGKGIKNWFTSFPIKKIRNLGNFSKNNEKNVKNNFSIDFCFLCCPSSRVPLKHPFFDSGKTSRPIVSEVLPIWWWIALVRPKRNIFEENEILWLQIHFFS